MGPASDLAGDVPRDAATRARSPLEGAGERAGTEPGVPGLGLRDVVRPGEHRCSAELAEGGFA